MALRQAIVRAVSGLAAAVTVGFGGSASWEGVDTLIRSRFPDVPSISTAELAAWLADATRPPPVLVDARRRDEYAVSHLDGARHVSPDDDPAKALAAVGRGEPIVVYCAVGYRSARMAAQLRAAGYRDVRNLQGSIFRWANEGRPLVREDRPVREVHPYDRYWGRLLRQDLRATTPPATR